jgi:parallel beta-helix repeat protein
MMVDAMTSVFRIVKTILICFVLIASSTLLTVPLLFDGTASGGLAPPPPTGDWIITGAESYSDTALEVKGNVTITGTGSLTLRNTTLMMNRSAVPVSIWFTVQDGGTLNIWDGDGDPATTDDASLLTDDDMDIDDGSPSDLRYYFKAEEGSSLHINNSVVEDCGQNSAPEGRAALGLYIGTNNSVIENTTFRNSFLAIVIENAFNTHIQYVNVTDATWAVQATNSDNTLIKNCWFNQSNTASGISVTGSDYVRLLSNNVSVLYTAHSITNSNYLKIRSSKGIKTSTSSNPATSITSSHFIDIDGYDTRGYRYVVKVATSNNGVLNDMFVDNIVNVQSSSFYGILLQSCYNMTVNNSHVDFIKGDAIKITSGNEIKILNTKVTRFNYEGIELSSNSQNCLLYNVTVQNGSGNSDRGVYFTGGSNNILTESIIEYGRYTNVYLVSTSNNIISNNRIIGKISYTDYGLYMISADNNKILNNTFNRDRYGIRISNSDNNVLDGNTLISYTTSGTPRGWGIDLNSANNNIVNDSYIYYFQDGISDYGNNNLISNTNVSSCRTTYYSSSGKTNFLENVSFYDGEFSGVSSAGVLTAKNSSFKDTQGANPDVSVGATGDIRLINSTYGTFSVAAGGLLTIQWWVEVYVEDSNGAVPGARVRFFNTTDDEVINTTVGEGARITLPVTEKYYDTSWKNVNPYNVTAQMESNLVNVTPRPTIDTNKKLTLTFSGDMPPAPAYGLKAVSTSDDVQITWDYYTLSDLDSFEIYRSTDPGSFGSTPVYVAGSGSRSWIDDDAASDWTTYYYMIRVNDTGGNLGAPSEVVFCGDWVVSTGNSTVVSSKSFQMNGTLKLENGSSLKLTDTKITFKNTYKGQYGIRVQTGGVLEIGDIDNNRLTTSDASNISTANASNQIYFIIEGDGKLYMNNSITYGVGYSGGPADHVGLYVAGSGSILRGNSIQRVPTTFDGILIVGASNVQVLDNTIEKVKDAAIYLKSSSECTIDNNIVQGAKIFGIYLVSTVNNTVGNNTVRESNYGIAIDTGDGDVIKHNTVENNLRNGINVEDSDKVTIFDNTIMNHTGGPTYGYAINIGKVTDSVIEANNMVNNEKGILVSQGADIDIIANTVDDCTEYGIAVLKSNNAYLKDNIISYAAGQGMYLAGFITEIYNTTVIGGNISRCGDGLRIEFAKEVNIENVEIWNNTNGMWIETSRFIDFNESSISASSSSGIHVEDKGILDPWTMRMVNCTLTNPSAFNIDIDTGAIVNSLNTTVPYDTVQFNDLSSKVIMSWFVHIYVEDMFGQAAPNANVTVKSSTGQFVDKVTDSLGYVRWLRLHDRTMLVDGNFTSNPHTISGLYLNHTGTNVTTISSSRIVTVYLDNEAPSALNVIITPSAPLTNENIELTFGYSDPENDPNFAPIIKWFKNGVEVPSLAGLTTVDSSNTAKGQTWYAKVQVYDGAAYSVAVESNRITVQNTKPVVSAVLLKQTSPSSSEDIEVEYTFSDADDDLEGFSTIKWYRDSGSGYVDSGLSGLVLNYTHTTKGDKWKAHVIPHDGEDFGTGVDSSNFATIGNSPPEVTDITFTPANPRSTENLEVIYTFYDIDGDTESGTTYSWFVDRDDGLGFVSASIFTKTVDSSVTRKGENWTCEVTPGDGGTALGLTVLPIDPVGIGNALPEILEVITIIPANPTSSDNLFVVYNYTDIDGDPEELTVFEWYVDRNDGAGFVISPEKGQTMASEDLLIKGQKWKCFVKPHDGSEFGASYASVEATIGNSPPEVSDLQILPEEPMGGEPLNARYKYFDVDDDTEDTSGRTIYWYRDGSEIEAYRGLISIPYNVTTKGVTIGNTPPMVLSPYISPEDPTNSDDLTAIYTSFDADEDAIVSAELEWYRNEVRIPGLDDLETVDSQMTLKQDVWYFKIRLFDGTDFSEWVTAPPKLIKNLVPELVVSPKDPNPVINETEELQFMAQAGDKDNDPLTYFWYVDGGIESLNFMYTLATNYDSNRHYTVKIEVSDGTAVTDFEWNVTVINMNRDPTISIISPEGQKNLKITTADRLEFTISPDDPDKEDKNNLDIDWYLDEGTEPVLSGVEIYVFQPGSYSVGRHEVTVVVTDPNGGTDTEIWNVTVGKGQTSADQLLGQSYDFWGLIIAVISGIVAGSMFLLGFMKMRKKQSKLKEYMAEIEGILDKDIKRSEKEKELQGLKRHIKNEFSQGLISENHYLILERELDDALGETRKAIVDRKVEMPKTIKKDVDKILDDGRVTKKEYKKTREKIMTSEELSDKEKKKLDKQLGKWVEEEDSEDDLDFDFTKKKDEDDFEEWD